MVGGFLAPRWAQRMWGVGRSGSSTFGQIAKRRDQCGRRISGSI